MKRLYRGGQTSPLLHDIDAIAWKALGWSDTPDAPATLSPTPTPIPLPPVIPSGIPAALALINGSNVARDIAIIPTVGQAAARVLIESRPEDGYPSLEDAWEANPGLLEGRFKVDPEAVAQWGGGETE
jgi:hypothetical protein